jgi:integrase
VSVEDRWHLSHPPKDAKKCSAHRKVPSAQHGIGKQWQVRGIDADGQPFKQNFEFEVDAKNKDAEVKTAVRAGTFVDERAGEITLEAFAEMWRASRVHDPTTAQRIKSTFSNHVYQGDRRGRTPMGGPSIGQYPMRVLARRVSLSQGWIRGIPLSPNTALNLIKDVSQVFKAAIDDKIIASNPLTASTIQKPDPVKTEAVALDRDELDALAAGLPEAMQAMAYLGANCGHRQGELAAVAVEDLDFFRKTCFIGWQVKHVNLTGVIDASKPKLPPPLKGWHLAYAPIKNSKGRTAPLAAPVVPVLSEHIRLHPPAVITLPLLREDGRLSGELTRTLVFHNRRRAWYTGTNYHPWDRARKKAGLPDDAQVYGWHALRHTAASQWLGGGLSLAKVAAYLGDTQEVILSTYSHFLPQEEDRAREIMDAFFAPRPNRQNAPVTPATLGKGSLWLVNASFQTFWEKFCRYWDVEPKYVPLVPGRYHLGVPEAVAATDENTIGVVAIMGSTMDGSYEPVTELAAALDALAATPDAPDVPIHVDAASGGFVAPFLHPEIEWDFRLKRVSSINSSGHKYGLVYPGVGWILWRDEEHLPEDLIFKVNYLGGEMPTFALNFSRPGAQVAAQYYNFLRLGYSGYKNVQQTAQDIALYLSGEVSKLGPFELLSDGSDLPVFAFKLRDDVDKYSVFDISERLRMRGWQVPAYTFPENLTDMAVMRIVIRNGFSMDLANLLLDDIKLNLRILEHHPQTPMPPEFQKKRKSFAH